MKTMPSQHSFLEFDGKRERRLEIFAGKGWPLSTASGVSTGKTLSSNVRSSALCVSSSSSPTRIKRKPNNLLAQVRIASTSLNTPGFVNMTFRQPFGVVAAIIPWNVPVLFFASKVAPAIAAGNCVVLKSSEKLLTVGHFVCSK